MKSPIDIVRGRIVDIDKHGIVTIKARYDDWPMLLKREYKECNTLTACLITRTTKRWSVSTEKNSVRDGLPVSGAEQADGKEVLK